MAHFANASARDAEFDDGGDREAGVGSLLEQFDLQHYLRTLRKYKWPITLFTAAVTALAAYYAFTATPVYRATSTLLIESQRANVGSIKDLVSNEAEDQDYYETQFALLRSRGLAQRVVEYMGLWDHPELVDPAATEGEAGVVAGGGGDGADGVAGAADGLPDTAGAGGATLDLGTPGIEDPALQDPGAVDAPATPGGVGRVRPSLEDMPVAMPDAEYFDERTVLTDPARIAVVQNFMKRLTVTPVRKTKLVTLSFDSIDPVFAARVANTVAEQYITSYLDAKMELTTKASEWLNERLTALRTTLERSKDKLIAYKQTNGLVDVDGSVGRLNEQELLLVTAELAQARSDLSEAADLYREVRSLRDQPNLLQSIPAIQADPLVQREKIEQGQAQRELDELRNRYGERHPRVVDASSRLQTINATLQGHIDRVVGTIEKDYQLSQQRVATIQSKLAEGKQEIQSLGTKTFELDALEREVSTNQNIYDTFFSRMSEANSADGIESANARVSDYAAPPAEPVKPRKELIIALAALGSLVLSMLMAFLYEQMDDTIKSTGDVENKLGVRLLGILPLVKGGLLKRRDALPLNPLDIPDAKGTFAEAVSTARTALCMDDGERPRKVILVTSSIPGEGKSTAAINLAYSLAQLERVLLVDCDLRRPTIAKAAGHERDTVGLSDLIVGTSSARECIKRGAFDGNMDILPSGPIPEQPLELLASKRFERILAGLAEHYDRIVIDCAPTQAVSDALVLSRLSDAVLYMVKSHDTSIELVRRGLQRLRQVNAPIAGVLMTQVDIDKITSYGGDYFYQGYYDYYGYTDKGERVKQGGRLRLSPTELQAIRADDREVDLELGESRHPDPATAWADDDVAPAASVSAPERALRDDGSGTADTPRATAPRHEALQAETAPRREAPRQAQGAPRREARREEATTSAEAPVRAPEAPRRRLRDDLDII